MNIKVSLHFFRLRRRPGSTVARFFDGAIMIAAERSAAGRLLVQENALTIFRTAVPRIQTSESALC